MQVFAEACFPVFDQNIPQGLNAPIAQFVEIVAHLKALPHAREMTIDQEILREVDNAENSRRKRCRVCGARLGSLASSPLPKAEK
jgi:hypothetical protein